MSTWTTHTICPGTPDDVLALLTEPGAIARWSPLPFSVDGVRKDRLHAGDRVSVGGELAGRGLVGRLLARATDALLAAGALRAALDRIARELELPEQAAPELEHALAA